ncbi:hypothetical protein [Breznakibacter xylanolyticus]|uniref:hypothetical protein n=1 Tax=Breznakibacter xylanolyticus TaxID=990 RepID=UPI000DAC8F92|nr:hypothetical protein [Breznakibacter xylanolyticus]MBN2743241.1 hypothetical protein [Marinilabiliaceae bacterium]
MICDFDLKGIRSHELVASLEMTDEQELEIKFAQGYGDLIIPIDPEMTSDHLMTVFYYYLENYKLI